MAVFLPANYPPIASVTRPNTVVYMGHSYVGPYSGTADSTLGPASTGFTNPNDYATSVFNQAQIQLGQPLEWLSTQGVTGATSTQIVSQLPAVLALNPGYVWLQCLSNDQFNGVTGAQSIANLQTIFQTLNANNIVVLFGTEYGRTGQTSPTVNGLTQAQNWAKEYARSHVGVIVVDCFDYFADFSSIGNSYVGAPNTTNLMNEASNYTHPNGLGAIAGAYPWVKQLSRILPPPASFNLLNNDGNIAGDNQNVLQNGKLIQGSGGSLGTGASGTIAQNCYLNRASGSIAAAGSIVTRSSVAGTFPSVNGGFGFDDGKGGYLQALAISAAAATTDVMQFFMYPTPARITVGSGPWVFEVEFGVNMTSGTLVNFFPRFSTGTPDFKIYQINKLYQAGDTLGQSKYYGKFRSRQFYIPTAGLTQPDVDVSISTSVGATGTVYLGNAVMRLVTA